MLWPAALAAGPLRQLRHPLGEPASLDCACIMGAPMSLDCACIMGAPMLPLFSARTRTGAGLSLRTVLLQ